jgi:hypothetical protein
MPSQIFAFKVSKPISRLPGEAQWRGTNKAVATEWYCTGGSVGYCAYCHAYYDGSSMTCTQHVCNGCCVSCDMV